MNTPRTKSRREVEFETRRTFIVETARDLLSDGDIEKISMDDIAAAAQYTRRTLYAYFKSRDEILLQVFSADLARRWKMQREAISCVDGAIGKIRTWAEVLYRFCCDNPSSVALQAYWTYRGIDECKISEELFAEFETLNDELADGLRQILNLGINDGTLLPDLDIDICISHFLYSLRAVIDRALSPTYSFARFDGDEYVARFLDLFIRGIRNQGELS